MNDMSSRVAASAVLVPARFTAAEFGQIMQAGLDSDIRLELTEGILERMSPPSNEHSTSHTLVTYRLMAALGPASLQLLRIELAIQLDGDTVRVPDVCLLRQATDAKGTIAADLVMLVVEIAEKTLAKDLGPKLEEYARAGVPHYWVVDGSGAVTHTYAEPEGSGYRRHDVVRFAEPLRLPRTDATITLT